MNAADVISSVFSQISQEVSFRLADMVVSYPEILRPVVFATIQACLNAQMETMPAAAKKLYDDLLAKMTVISVPQALDPRRRADRKKEDTDGNTT